MISPTLAGAFAQAIRTRGEKLHASGAVRVEYAGPSAVLAAVQGSMPYACALIASRAQLTMSCSCSYATQGNACKHLWALLLATHESGALGTVLDATEGLRRVRLDPNADVQGLAEQHADASAPPVERPRDMPTWEHALERARWRMQFDTAAARRLQVDWPADKRIVYVLDVAASRNASGVVLELATEKRARDGAWGPPKTFDYPLEAWAHAPDDVDRAMALQILGSADRSYLDQERKTFVLQPSAYEAVLRVMCEHERLRLRTPLLRTHLPTLRWDAGGRTESLWQFTVDVRRMRSGEYVLGGVLTRGNERLPLDAPELLHPSGLVIVRETVARFDHQGTFPLVTELQAAPGMAVGKDLRKVLQRLYAMPHIPEFTVPEPLDMEESRRKPVPILTLAGDAAPWQRTDSARLELAFRYGTQVVAADDPGPVRYCAEHNTLHHRHPEAEAEAQSRLMELGAARFKDLERNEERLIMPRKRVPALTHQLAREGWLVEADGRAFRTAGALRTSVRSGVDWFDLEGVIEFGDLRATLADVMAAQKRGEDSLLLEDGSYGLLPSDWLARLAPLLAAGTRVDDRMRFGRSQLTLLDALLATMPEVDADAAFAHARAQLARFEHITPADPPPGFRGQLREYQREGLGWLHFLREFGFGGCLADDMGLGKTIQVLAMLEGRRADGGGTSLVVVPRSLVFNWRAEAERFTPHLRVLEWSNTARRRDAIDLDSVDLLIVTYGTLRRDAAALADFEFDYVVLDEAQAIKNSTTATAKAARLLRASHRLALSGTPVENRIEELWSLLDFLNPGMLGASRRFAAVVRSANAREELLEADMFAISEDEDAAAGFAPGERAGAIANGAPGAAAVDDVLARALRPIILRRTKAEVAPDLPERLERTLEVELEPKQRAFYDTVREQYRASVLQRLATDGLQKSRMHILEALLRLRQAACHPVLADKRRKNLPSAKLDALIPALVELRAEGNKALVFSQFTSFLALVRTALDEEGIPYEYLDGRTRDREARVERFQNDPACPVFLISLKAGGHGLNLTAADYVYLLDPWWNPAVEAQAIDRAHRIGRHRRVIATRLVARDTIEAKILELQDTKRALADAILTADKGVLASIGREELELLLG